MMDLLSADLAVVPSGACGSDSSRDCLLFTLSLGAAGFVIDSRKRGNLLGEGEIEERLEESYVQGFSGSG